MPCSTLPPGSGWNRSLPALLWQQEEGAWASCPKRQAGPTVVLQPSEECIRQDTWFRSGLLDSESSLFLVPITHPPAC